MTVDVGDVLTYAEAKELVDDPHACLKSVNAVKHVALLPSYIGRFGEGIKQVLNAELKLYSEQLGGVILSYNNIQRERDAMVIDHYPQMHLDIQADFIVFQPKVGSVLKGVVNKLGTDHIGLLVHKCFNGSVPIDDIPSEKIKIGMTLTFLVNKIYTSNRLLCFNGKLTDESKTQLGQVVLNRKRSFSEVEEDTETTPKKKKKKKSLSEAEEAEVTLNDTKISTLEEESETTTPKKKKKKKAKEEVEDSETTPKKKKKKTTVSDLEEDSEITPSKNRNTSVSELEDNLDTTPSSHKKKKKKKSKKEDKDE